MNFKALGQLFTDIKDAVSDKIKEHRDSIDSAKQFAYKAKEFAVNTYDITKSTALDGYSAAHKKVSSMADSYGFHQQLNERDKMLQFLYKSSPDSLLVERYRELMGSFLDKTDLLIRDKKSDLSGKATDLNEQAGKILNSEAGTFVKEVKNFGTSHLVQNVTNTDYGDRANLLFKGSLNVANGFNAHYQTLNNEQMDLYVKMINSGKGGAPADFSKRLDNMAKSQQSFNDGFAQAMKETVTSLSQSLIKTSPTGALLSENLTKLSNNAIDLYANTQKYKSFDATMDTDDNIKQKDLISDEIELNLKRIRESAEVIGQNQDARILFENVPNFRSVLEFSNDLVNTSSNVLDTPVMRDTTQLVSAVNAGMKTQFNNVIGLQQEPVVEQKNNMRYR